MESTESRLVRLLQSVDPSARLDPRQSERYCTTARCLCKFEVWLSGHRIMLGHAALDDSNLDIDALYKRIAATPCACCKAARRAAKREESQAPETRTCLYCGATGHIRRACTLGSTSRRSDQFLSCSAQCFARRFVVPLHRASLDFAPDDLRAGRIDVAARCITAAIVGSQRLRHNSQLWLPFLGGGEEHAATLCVSGGLTRGLHPSEQQMAKRIRAAIDVHTSSIPPATKGIAMGVKGVAMGVKGVAMGVKGVAMGVKGVAEDGDAAAADAVNGTIDGSDGEGIEAPTRQRGSDTSPGLGRGGSDGGGNDGGGGRSSVVGAVEDSGTAEHANLDRELLGFSLHPATSLAAAVRAALSLAREGGCRAPLLLLTQGALPLEQLLAAEFSPPPADLVCVLGDDLGLSSSELGEIERLGAEHAAAGGGPLLRASLGSGTLLASHAIVIVHHYLDALHECPSRLWSTQAAEAVSRGARQRRRRTQRQQRVAPHGGASGNGEEAEAHAEDSLVVLAAGVECVEIGAGDCVEPN